MPDRDKKLLLSLPLPKTIMARLADKGFEARFCGGVVRDAVIGKLAKTDLDIDMDIDMATTALPQVAMEVLEKAGLKIGTIGIDHGTITIRESAENRVRVELTSLRRDIKTDGRHAEVEFGEDWQADSNRRDFTINSLTMDGNGKVFDFQGGVADAKDGVLRFIGDPHTRLAEDYLRVLRYFRFHVDFNNMPPDAKTRTALREAAPHLKKLSGERIYKELNGILAKYAPKTIDLMDELEILRGLLDYPLNVDAYKNLQSLRKQLLTSLRLRLRFKMLRLAVLVAERDAENFAYHLHMPASSRRLFLNLSKNMEDELVTTLIAPDSFWQTAVYRRASSLYFLVDWLVATLARTGRHYDYMKNPDDIKQRIREIANFKPKKMPVTGNDVMKITGAEGKEVGVLLDMLEEEWLASKFTMTREELLAQLKSHHTKTKTQRGE